MLFPELYPEPNNCILSSGFFKADGSVAAYVDVNAAVDWPFVHSWLNSLLKCSVTESDINSAGIIFRDLQSEDIEFAAGCFKRDYGARKQYNDAFFLHVSNNRIVIAASCRGGFFYALQALGKLASADYKGIKAGILFDYACMKTRAVNLLAASCGDKALIKLLIGVLADLRYNTLIVDWERLGIEAQGDMDELNRLCEENFIDVMKQTGEAAGIIDNFHGPSFLDWEHQSRLPNIIGAAVIFEGVMNEAELVRSGFLFNLVYSATMLWYDEYNNFSWEKAVEPAMRHALAATRMLQGKQPALSSAEADIYPAMLQFEGEKFRQRPERVVMPGQTCTVTEIGEKAHGLLFSHTLEVLHTSYEGCGIRTVGRYTVHYLDGTSMGIPLVENESIGPDNIWCGRRYNAKTHQFDTDARLHRLCCRTRPVKKVLSDGKLAIMYELEWENPEPARPIARVELAVGAGAGVSVCLYSMNIINNSLKDVEQE